MNFITTNIDLIIICAYMSVIFVMGLYAGRNMKNLKDYAIASHSYSAFVLFATLSASFIGGGFSFGNADTVFESGLGPATALWGFSLTLILISLFVAPKVAKFSGCISAGDVMQKNFGKTGKIIAGILGALVCIGILGAQVGAMGAVFETFSPLTFEQGVIVGCSIVIVYTSFGGMKAVVVTDVIQFLMLVIFIPLALFLGIDHVGGFDAIQDKTPNHYFEVFTDKFSPFMWGSLFLSFMIGETLVPPYLQRLLIAKNTKETIKGTLYSAILSVPFFIITGMLGIVAFAINPDMPSANAMPTVINTVLPIGIKSLACAAIISIVMSSADSFLNSATVCIIEDVIKPIAKIKNFAKELLLAKVLSLFLGLGAVVLALKISNVLDILRFAYNFWAPVMLVPLLATFLGYKPKMQSFIMGAVGGVFVIAYAFITSGAATIYGIDAVVIGFFANLILFVIGQKVITKN